MSYSQFGYSYPSSSQILVSGQHPGSVSPCCQSSGAAESHGSPPQTAAVCNLSAAYDSRLLSSFPRIATGFGLYGSSYADQGYISTLAGTNPSAFYSSLPSPYDLKESRNSWTALQQTSAPACYPYDPSGLASCGPYADRYSSIDSVARRKNATRETTNTLKAWLYEHRKNPYPTKGEKIMLAIITKMTLTQVSTWFANARRRLKKENKMTWEPRNKTSEGDDRDSSSPRDIKSDDNTEDCADSNLPDFLKQESGGYASKHSFPTEFEDPSIEPKPHNHTAKDCSSYGLDCYRVQGQSSEDSTNSGSPSPARPLQTSCYSDAQQRFESGKVDQKDSVFCPVEQNASSFGSGSSSRPKIWSLARTATSNSPPMIRRSVLPCPVDFCLEGGQKDEDDCAKMKPSGLSGGSCSYSDFTQDRTSGLPPRKHPTGDLCCDRSVYSSVLPSCGVPTKCESSGCLGSRESGSCMIDNHCSYAADYTPNLNEGAEHYGYDDKHYKDKSVGSMGYPSTKCQPHDNSVVASNPVPEKLSAAHPPGLLGYSENVAARNDYFSAGNFDQTLHEQNIRAIHKSSSNQDVAASMEMTDPGSLLRRNDH